MRAQSQEQYFEPVDEGVCEVLRCSSSAKYRVSWAGGIIVRLVCLVHKAQVEGNSFEEALPAFGWKQRAKQR